MTGIKNFMSSAILILAVVLVLILINPTAVEEISYYLEDLSYQTSSVYESEININQIITSAETEVYWGENDDIGSNLYMANVGDLFDRNTHPLEKHGIKAVATLLCISNGRGVMEVKNSETGRKAVICNIDINDLLNLFTLEEIQEVDPSMTIEKLNNLNGKYGVGIFESDGTSKVTLFIKEQLKNLDQVIRYLGNRGYVR